MNKPINPPLNYDTSPWLEPENYTTSLGNQALARSSEVSWSLLCETMLGSNMISGDLKLNS